MTDHNDKKTLTLTGRLSLSPNKNLGTNTSVVRNASSHSKGRVVVVTKQTRSPASKPAATVSNSPNDALLNHNKLIIQEHNKRLTALKNAEILKKEVEVKKLEEAALNEAQDQQVMPAAIVDVPVVEESAVVATEEAANEEYINALSFVENHNKEHNITQDVAPKIEPSKINLDDLLRKNKVKNLNDIYRPAPAVAVTPEDAEAESTSVTPDSDAKPFAPKHPLNTGVKKQSNAEFEEERKNAILAKKEEDRKAPKKLSVAQVMMMDPEEGANLFNKRRSMASIKRARDKVKRKMIDNSRTIEKVIREVVIPDFITVQELAIRMAEKTADVIKSLMKLGMIVTMNQSLDADTAELVISEFGHKIKRVTESEIEAALLQKIDDKAADTLPRAPVVTIMGHVDHGKTSLLDALRNTDVAAGEAGGITQHIGAYQVTLENKKVITFLDTPGHEAFTAMRMRGASVTDIVVLVVAADDGIMPQTIEAISHAKAANVPIIVAINKIDKPGANPLKIQQDLLQHGIVPESMGGDAIIVEVSAKQKINLDKLEELILLQAEVLDFRANPNRLAEGIVIEAKVDKGRGPVATLLIQKGTIRTGEIVVAGTTYGKIKALVNDKGKHIEFAGPSTPVEILGLDQVPTAGDEFTVAPNDKTARDLVNLRHEREKQKRHSATKPVSLDIMFKRAIDHGIKELPVVIKGDVQGSVEAIVSTLKKLATDEISVRVLHQAVGGITESDVTLATASQALIIGFNVRANNQAREMAKVNSIEIKYYSIIYNLVDEIKAAMSGMLSPTRKENGIGYVEVRNVFNLTKYGLVAGCYVTEGLVRRHAHARIIRDNVVVYNGKLKALKRFKDDVKEVGYGFECGLSFENYDQFKVGDKVEIYEVSEHARTL